VTPTAAASRPAPLESTALARSSVSDPRVVLPVVAIAAVVGVLVATTRYGIGLTPDSVVYVTGARSLADGHGYTHLDGGAIGSWPPGYSFVLSLGERIGIDALDGAVVLSAVSLVATVVLTYVLLRRHVRSPGVRAAGVVVVGCSAVLLEVFSEALSEHLFIPVLLAFILVCEELLIRPADLRLFAGAVFLAWAAFYLRYAGIVTVAIGGLIMLAAGSRSRFGPALLRAGAFVVLAASLPVVWMIRNVEAGGDPMGPRADASFTLASNVRRVANEASQWFATQLAPPAVRALVGAVLVVALAGLVVLLFTRRAQLPADWRRIVPLALVIVVYTGYLVASASIVAFGAINTRFLLPVFVPTVVLTAWLFEKVRDQLRSQALRTAMTLIGVAWVVVNVMWFAGRAIGYAADGAGGYASERWHNSALMKDVALLDTSVPTYSNDARAVAIFTDKPVQVSVSKTFFNSDSETGHLPNFVRRVECNGRAQLIWFLPNGASYLYTLDELREHVRLTPMVERADGIIYEVTPRDPASAACPRAAL
jgi:hypothetical protein